MLLLLLACAAAPEPPARQLVEARSEQAELLEVLGYVDGTVDPQAEQRGVLQHDPARVSPGLSLYYSRTQQQAQLIEADGTVVHTWAARTEAPWQHVELDPVTGGVLVLMKDVGIVALDRDGRQRWAVEGRFHHNLTVDAAGNIHALSRVARRIPELNAEIDVLDDLVVVLSPEGEVLEQWSVLEALRASPYAFLLPEMSRVRPRGGADLDPLHTNHVAIFDGSLAARSPRYAAGNVLLSLRNVNTVLILDGRTREVQWLWGPGNVVFQHHPTVLEDGRMLIFDNGRRQSRVIELDPDRLALTWLYEGPPRFYSKTRGSAQRLENGNTLITISDTGYVIEVTPAGEVVWEFANPDVDEQGLRGAIWRMTRYPPGSLPFLEGG